MKLRLYQNNCVDAIFAEWNSGKRSTLTVLPTGTGKTVVFADIIRRVFPKRAMVIAHREELIWQARDKIQSVTGIKADVEMGNYKSSQNGELFHPRASVIVSTVQTHCAGGDGGGRMSKFDPMDFGLLIIDEAHHAAAETYKRVIAYYCQNPNLVVLGVTATPDRADEEALGQIFESVAFNYEILDAIHDGWLVLIEQHFKTLEDFDLSNIRTTAGDLNGADLAEVFKHEKTCMAIVDETVRVIGENKRGIGFCASVEHARISADIMNRYRSGMAASINGKMDKDERKKIITDFAAGKIQFLWNCAVFTEGFDDSGVEVITMARPTKSRALYAQMAGRATRPHESIAHRLNDVPVAALRRGMIARSIKQSCLILDFIGNSGRHKLITSANILGGNVSDEAIQAAVAAAKKSGKPVKMAELLDEEEEKLAAQKKRELEESARKARLVAKTTYKTQKIDPFDVFQIKPVISRGWDKGKVLSPKQKEIMREKMGLNPDEFTYKDAKVLIDHQFKMWNEGLCSFKMIKMLKKFGINAVGMKKEVGKAWRDAIEKNGWRRPVNFVPPSGVKVPPRPSNMNGGLVDSDVPF